MVTPRVTGSVSIAGVRIDAIGFDEVVDRIVAHARANGAPAYVVTPNTHHVTMLQSDAKLRRVYEEAFLSVPDGVPLLWAGKLLGEPLRGRVNGTDLFEALCAKAAHDGLRVFLLGGREGAAEAARAVLEARNPGLSVSGTYCPPLGFEHDREECARIVAAIDDAHPHLLFVGLGAPKQEYWMYDNRASLSVPMSLGIGVSFEFVGGVVRRSPVWMQRAGLEWFYRLITEPKRMWRRYLVCNVAFCALVARQLLTASGRR
jgi:N-acetylglucosaminyldiphosphoundecaprenol N-acetyl-beta-D-mannosaminyltransferase